MSEYSWLRCTQIKNSETYIGSAFEILWNVSGMAPSLVFVDIHWWSGYPWNVWPLFIVVQSHSQCMFHYFNLEDTAVLTNKYVAFDGASNEQYGTI